MSLFIYLVIRDWRC